jgi:hypothetical protein
MKSTKFPELRVKIKSLAAEARIIRAEEARHPRSSLDWWRRSIFLTIC